MAGRGLESHAYQKFVQNCLRSSGKLVSILCRKIIPDPSQNFVKNMQYKDLYLKSLQNSEGDFFSGVKLMERFQQSAICSPKVPVLYMKPTMGPGGSTLRPQDQGLLGGRGQEKTRACLGDSSGIGKSREGSPELWAGTQN